MSNSDSSDQPPLTPTSIRKVLRIWHSTPELGKHPLAGLKLVQVRQRAANYLDTLEDRGRALRDVLRDAINTFPHETVPSGSESEIKFPDKEWRPYVILTERFVNGRSPNYVAALLGIASRTYFVEQAQALSTLADILRRREEALLAGPLPSSPISTADRPARPALTEAIQQFEIMPLDTLPAPTALPPGSLMPLSRNPLFVGRERDLKTLARVLKGGETAAIGQSETAATTGLGGIGKTQLASEFVHRYGRFFSGGVFWLSFADPKAVPSEVAPCGGVGHLELRPNFGDLTLEDQLRLVRAAWQEPVPRLLVFDNCEDPELLDRWRPPSGGCRILVTSRRADWEPILGIKTLALDVLQRDESLALLQYYYAQAEEAILDAIAAELGDLPLALHLAGSYLARYRRVITPAQYLEQLRDPALLEHPSLKGSGISPTHHDQNAFRTIALSHDKLDPDDRIDE